MQVAKSCHLALFVTVLCVTPALSQNSRTSSVIVGAGNPENSNVFENYGGSFDPDGGLVQSSGSTVFIGLDSNSQIQEMDYSGAGMASADYGLLRTQASGSVSNIYYNPDNDPLLEPGDYVNPCLLYTSPSPRDS